MMSKPNVSQRPRNQDEERDTVRALSMALRFAAIQRTDMRKILETEEHVQIPSVMYSDPFYRITYLIKEEIRKYKWIEGKKGRKLSWEQAPQE
jgi:hypothetical protein